MTEADLLFELMIVPLDAPSDLGLFDEVAERSILRQGREPVFDGFGLACRPLDEEPFLGPRRWAPVIPMCRPDADGGEA